MIIMDALAIICDIYFTIRVFEIWFLYFKVSAVKQSDVVWSSSVLIFTRKDRAHIKEQAT